MTQPTKKQISDFDSDDGPADLRLATVAKYMIRKNGLLVTCCLSLIIYQVWDRRQHETADAKDRRELDNKVIGILMSNAKILSDLTSTVRENDVRDQKSLEEMKPIVTRNSSILEHIEATISRIEKQMK